MKKLYGLIAILSFPLFIQAQTTFSDDFTDGDFTANPQWFGETAKYTVNGSNELQINDLGNTADGSLYVPVNIQDSTTWEFLIKTALTTSGPSASNRVRIYLQSDNSDFTANLNGYYLQFGESGTNDALEIFRVTNGSASSILVGTLGQMSGPTNNVRVRVIRDNAGNWELFADYAGGTTFVSEGTATDNTHSSGGFFGVQTFYSSTQGDKFSYDDFLISPLFVDNVAPNIQSATAISATEVDILFDEALDAGTANIAGSYTINNGVTVNNAQLDGGNPALVHLTVSALTNQTTYQLTANGVEDLAGNAIVNGTASFTYILVVPAGFQDVIFNEIMIDPNPVVNLPDAEYIELYNRSNAAIDLNNYELIHRSFSSGAETDWTLSSYILQPGEYVILHDDPSYAGTSNNIQLSSFSGLNNTSAYLILRDTAGGTLIDSILYSNDWYNDTDRDGGGYSIELKNPNLVCKGGDNWAASTSPDGGTPGAVNSILDNTVDTTAPVILNARQSGVNRVVLTFDDILDPVSMTNTGNYTITGGLTIIFAQLIDQYSVELTLNANMTANTEYTVNVGLVSDCVGNSASRQATFTYFETEEAVHYDIIINEIFADANPVVGLPEQEFVELYNRSAKNINLEGYEFTDGTSNIAIFPFYIIQPGEYLIIYKQEGTSYSSFGDILEFTTFPDLDVGSDDLVLTNSFGNEIDAVSYDNSWYGDGDKAEGGWTLERINPNSPCEGRDNWTASIAQPPAYPTVGGTPGQANSVEQDIADQQAPDVYRAYPFATEIATNGDSVRLYFSEAMGDSSGVNAANYNLTNPGIDVIGAYLEPPFYNTIVIITDVALQPGTIYELTMNSGLTDCVGNPIGLNNTVEFALPDTFGQGDLVLNEILFNPVTGGSDYIELYNNSDKVIDVGALFISNTESDSLLDDANDVKAEYLLFPQDYVVLTDETVELEAIYRTEDPERTPNINKMIEFDLPSFPNDEGTIVIYTLQGSNAVFVDSFYYSEDYHSPLIDDLNGVALERIDFDAPTIDADNWHSGAQPVNFGTPTYINSSSVSNDITDDGLIQLPNTIFSPDDDGFEDFLLINYNIDDVGYLADIAVYDAQGRFVRQLVQNELLMREGSVKWDGSTENGEKALIGPYVIVADIFNPNGDRKRYKVTCVLAGQLGN